MNKVRIIAATVAASTVLSGCATGPNRNPNDPLEPMNRAMYKFNDTVDTNIAVPIAKGYQKITPTPMRTAISNFFSNLGDLGNMANNLLQLRITDATQDLMRVAMNSVFGVAGLIDIATPAGLPKHHQDFGLTMARWGMPSGPYLVLPVFGPSTIRDGVGRAVDVRFNLLNYIEPAARNPMYIAQFISARSDLLGATDLLKQAALDPYSFVRDAYLQQRKSLTYRGQSASATPPNYAEPGEAGAVPAAAPAMPGLPNYEDPGEAGGASGAAPNNAPAALGLPQYDDPGADGAMPASAPAAAPAAASAGATTAPAANGAPIAPAMPTLPASTPAAQ
ncbi:ABC transporter [Burkholderia ambifaria]|uniref:VacJ family lipoprotein n=1 Tax=Burkholderia ambifaria (strain ATCC BAA-244 / DSM 16087 / CCUG 44356 / LMG 19182 / AMMD) TaxID=339670 RepID=Q0B5S5_BURCM|nr:VacJ family lipoprotein [Burkholderia ambifaria]ABI90498.1 VacJ family lipoprotein [Burkholderia ambifaria AMMD]MBR7931726.1 VacJ family lipoprotein [Burkholderia ambifaria]PEH68542.1 ABC transporter [Burkholderia ambifaria]QQC06884.1 VacJ family lipoprotein [Burkholderia ambifaria]UZU01813.1 VacJ family lipoprotein [Burkholderia ambifaria]